MNASVLLIQLCKSLLLLHTTPVNSGNVPHSISIVPVVIVRQWQWLLLAPGHGYLKGSPSLPSPPVFS